MEADVNFMDHSPHGLSVYNADSMTDRERTHSIDVCSRRSCDVPRTRKHARVDRPDDRSTGRPRPNARTHEPLPTRASRLDSSRRAEAAPVHHPSIRFAVTPTQSALCPCSIAHRPSIRPSIHPTVHPVGRPVGQAISRPVPTRMCDLL
ncbi:t109 [Tupaiid betaherpesvirus 1]|uniref:T109 n=1 Tax=Tupaiid herpesvirus 1 (strain 1) TaxID=10397 RepID=Q91TJ4_TUHV1|nr:t109 [Tupaiid betaherpesvirus 1]AAK57153.1 t109 [Tupaiid betaherpesvirus 1]